MNLNIALDNLWIFYVLAYVIALPIQSWANKKRGEPFDDPEFLYGDKKLVPIAMLWIGSGFVISLFVPVRAGAVFYVGLLCYIVGMVVVALTFYSFAQHRGLVKTGIHRYSRNPGYVGWLFVIFGLALMGWSVSFWSMLFLLYFLATIVYFHWTIKLEEAFLVKKYGDSYWAYLRSTSRYFSLPKGERGA